MRFIKILLFVVVVAVLSSGLYIGHQLVPEESSHAKENDQSETNIEALDLDTINPFKGDQALRILVMGIDKTATTSLSEEANPTRSDTIMLFTIDPVRERAQLLSLPRDTYITIPTTGEQTKLGHAFAYGGPELSMRTVEEFLDTDIDYYGIVDYKAVERLVDAIGGVEVDIPQDYTYEDPTTVPPLKIDFKKGPQLLDGKEAVKFLRIRKPYQEQDIGRIQAQQGFLMTVFDQLKTPSIIFKIPELIDIAVDHVSTDLNYGQIAYLAKMGLGFEKEDIVLDTLVGEDTKIGDIAYYIVDQDQAQEQLRRFDQGKGSFYQEMKKQEDKTQGEDVDDNVDELENRE